MYDYNTQKPKLILREYGRNVQKLVEFLNSTEDSAKRDEYAKALVELMKQVTPTVKDTSEVQQKLWDDMHIMSDFTLDINGPFPKPERDILSKKPMGVPYSQSGIKFKHFGKNIELLVEKACELKDKEDQEAAVIYIGKLMKSFFATWSKENIEDEVILKNIRDLSKGQLDIDIDKVKEGNLFKALYKEKERDRDRSGGKRKGGGKQKRRRN